MWPLRWLVLWSLWSARLVRQRSPSVRIQQGELSGQLAPDGSHYQYLGIPYASSSPKYRFQAAGPAPSWSGVFEAIEEHVRCPQMFGDVMVGREECLVLNVYSPVHAHHLAPLPVMVFIHGGGFKEGSSSHLLYGPDYLVARGVVLVTFNYRLNVLGFLCLGINEAPGNAGLKDQVAALRWVKNNIRSFAGDPDNVTIFGESAGGASVSYHLLSPLSRGLFHKAIIQSGSSIAPWARQMDPLRTAIDLAKAVGHSDVEDPYLIYDILKNKTINNLVSAQLPRIEGQLKYTHLPFVPCIEPQTEGAFITDVPFNILSKGDYYKIPVIIGTNNEEGYFFAAYEDDHTLNNIKFEKVLPKDLVFPSDLEYLRAATQMKELYLGDEEVSWYTILKLSKLHGEPQFTYPCIVETELLIKTNEKVYSYLFEYDGWRNFPKLISGLTYWLADGATHADELFYLFYLFPVPSLFETEMINTMTLLWTNFAKYSAPGRSGGAPVWPRARDGTLRLSAAPQPHVAPLASHRPRHMHFWRQLYREHRATRTPDIVTIKHNVS